MTHPLIVNKFRKKPLARLVDSISTLGSRKPMIVVGALLGVGFLAGGAAGLVGTAGLRMQLGNQQAQLATAQRQSQREINALAARLGELQAEANRLNALGERLTRIGQLQDGEFNFDKPVGVGGAGPVRDISAPELREGLDTLNRQFADSGDQLSVLESMLFNRQLDMNSVPSREPIANSYITSSFGRRADPIVGGSQFHKGIDFEADVGDPVLAVADGVVSYSGVRSGLRQRHRDRPRQRLRHPLCAQLPPGTPHRRADPRGPGNRQGRLDRSFHWCTRPFRSVGKRPVREPAQVPEPAVAAR
jgi:murein DD-endopeptidase MepM/ murein hydrolase activator NlpD